MQHPMKPLKVGKLAVDPAAWRPNPDGVLYLPPGHDALGPSVLKQAYPLWAATQAAHQELSGILDKIKVSWADTPGWTVGDCLKMAEDILFMGPTFSPPIEPEPPKLTLKDVMKVYDSMKPTTPAQLGLPETLFGIPVVVDPDDAWSGTPDPIGDLAASGGVPPEQLQGGTAGQFLALVLAHQPQGLVSSHALQAAIGAPESTTCRGHPWTFRPRRLVGWLMWASN